MPASIGVLEVKMVERKTPKPEHFGGGIHFEVRWVGRKYPNGFLDVEGPYCPRDDTLLSTRRVEAMTRCCALIQRITTSSDQVR
jgi:hypothetical protein